MKWCSQPEVAAAVVVVGCVFIAFIACTHPTPTTQTIYQSLVEAGCLADTPDGPAAVAAERALPHPPPWLLCMADGGTVSQCEVPCKK